VESLATHRPSSLDTPKQQHGVRFGSTMYLDVQGTTSSYHNSDGICYFEVWDSSRPLCFFRRPLCDGLRAVSSINTLRLARLMDTTISAKYPAVHICM